MWNSIQSDIIYKMSETSTGNRQIARGSEHGYAGFYLE